MAKRGCGGRQASWARIDVVSKSVVREVGEGEGEDEGECQAAPLNSGQNHDGGCDIDSNHGVRMALSEESSG
jgi:hypothetical protein